MVNDKNNSKLPMEFEIGNNNDNKDIEYLNETAKHLFKSNTYKEVAVRSDVNKNEILAISLLRGINTNLNFKSIDSWTIDLLRLRYSKDRKSRGEFIETMSNIFTRMNGAVTDGINNLKNGLNGFNRGL